MGSATIIGADPRTSPCSGGMYIKIDGNPNPNDPINGYYEIDNVPAPFHLDALGKFPVQVQLNWGISTKCYGNYLDITKMKLIN